MKQFYFLAQYSCDAYGVNAYSECSTTGSTSPNSTTNPLANTGFDIIIPVALGIALIIAGVILFFKRLRRVSQKSLSD